MVDFESKLAPSNTHKELHLYYQLLSANTTVWIQVCHPALLASNRAAECCYEDISVYIIKC